MLHIWIVTTFCQAFIPRAGRIPRESDKGAQGNLWAKICGLIYSKHLHIFSQRRCRKQESVTNQPQSVLTVETSVQYSIQKIQPLDS